LTAPFGFTALELVCKNFLSEALMHGVSCMIYVTFFLETEEEILLVKRRNTRKRMRQPKENKLKTTSMISSVSV
jgi:hypothetical protein